MTILLLWILLTRIIPEKWRLVLCQACQLAEKEGVWPLAGGIGVSANNYPRYHSSGNYHSGVDINQAPVGTPILSAYSGIVTQSRDIFKNNGEYDSYGRLVVVRSVVKGQTIDVFYAHLHTREVKETDSVQAGELIGTLGYNGNVIPAGPAGAHLHFEVRIGGQVVDPRPYLPSKG